MSTVHYYVCDRCGTKIGEMLPDDNVIEYTVYDVKMRLELCDKCREDFYNWAGIKGKDESVFGLDIIYTDTESKLQKVGKDCMTAAKMMSALFISANQGRD